MSERINVLDDIGFAELVDYSASDLNVVNAARVSYAKTSEEMTERDEKLIGYLMRNRHGSPFEHNMFSFRVKAPLFVRSQWERHRMASYNEQSGRWSEFLPEFYMPEPEIELASAFAYNQYQLMLARGVPKERARIALPQGTMTMFWYTTNARSLMNFLSLRNDDHAQSEIREYAQALEAFFMTAMPVTYTAFMVNGRVAP